MVFADTNEMLEMATAAILREVPELLAIYVFGSTASDERTERSDLDRVYAR